MPFMSQALNSYLKIWKEQKKQRKYWLVKWGNNYYKNKIIHPKDC